MLDRLVIPDRVHGERQEQRIGRVPVQRLGSQLVALEAEIAATCVPRR